MQTAIASLILAAALALPTYLQEMNSPHRDGAQPEFRLALVAGERKTQQ
jgi:hypothetical protein